MNVRATGHDGRSGDTGRAEAGAGRPADDSTQPRDTTDRPPGAHPTSVPRAGDAPTTPPGVDTRRRLLAAAEHLFAEKGFGGASVRELTQEAQVNLASVNYHFGGKLNLYVELFRQTLAELRAVRIERIDEAMAQPDVTLEALLRAFSEGFIDPLIEDGRGRRLMQLYGREMQEPLLPANLFFEELIDPIRVVMHRHLPEVCPGLQERDVEYVLMLLVGQLLHVVHMTEHNERMGSAVFAGMDMASMIDHIVQFSAAGIRHFATQGSD